MPAIPRLKAQLRPRLPLLLLLAIFACLAIAYSRATPLGEAPDEPTHVQYVLFLRENGRLPQVLGRPDGLPQGKHPPLYYLAGALLSARAEFATIGFVRNRHFSHNLDNPPVAGYFVHRDLDGPIDERDAQGRLAVALLRLVSVLSGLVVVAGTWWLARILWPTEPTMAFAAAAVAAFLPGYLFFSGVYNNDTLATACVTLSLALSIRLIQGHDRPRDLAALGAVLGLGLITKLTTLPAIAFAGLALLGHLWRTRHQGAVLPRLLRSSLSIGLPTALISGWWFLRNMRLYGLTDPLGTGAWSESIGHQLREVPLSTEIGTYLWIQFTTFWGRFGWGSVPLPKPLYIALLALCALAILGLLTLTLLQRSRLTPDQRWSFGLILLAVLLIYAAVFRLALQFNLIVAHGRYLYPALPGLAVLFSAGLLGPWPTHIRRIAAPALAAAMLALGLWSYQTVLAGAFAPPPQASESEIATIDWPLDLLFDGRLRLVGVGLEGAPRGWDALTAHRTLLPDGNTVPTIETIKPATLSTITATEAGSGGWPYIDVPHLTPGQPITLTLLWRSERDFWDEGIIDEGGSTVARNDVAFAHLLDADGEVAARIDQIPFDGTWPTMAWPPGATYTQRLPLTLPATTPLGQASLLVGLYEDGHPNERYPTTGTGGDWSQVLEDAVSFGPWLLLEPESSVIEPQQAAPVFQGHDDRGKVRLLNSEVAVQPEHIDVSIVWRAEQPASPDTTAFIHLVGPLPAPKDRRGFGPPAAPLVTQADGVPVGGRLPLHLWPPLQPIPDSYRLEIPPGLAPGQYQVRVGFYTASSGNRWDAGWDVSDISHSLPRGVFEPPTDGAFPIAELTLP